MALDILIVLFQILHKNSLIFQQPVQAASPEAIDLEEPQSEIAVNLIEALKLRKSTKSFTNVAVSMKDLSTILWAANGVNRDNGKRTAPSAYGKYFIEIYVASNQGVYQYEAVKHQLKLVTKDNIKGKLAGQNYVGKASQILIFTAKLDELPFFVKNEQRITCAHATAGAIGENVYLTVNALQLGTSLVAGINGAYITTSLGLNKNEVPLYVMPIGYPK